MHSLYAIFLVVALNIYPMIANPVQPNLELMEARAPTNNNSYLMSPKAWIPILVIVLLLCLAVLMTWSRNTLRKTIAILGGTRGVANVGAPGTNPMGARREVTAEQLVGSINATDLPTRQTRRTRRPRRTPSQVSVTSLPAYNKEPGEEELVIFRGRDMEDVTMPLASTADEDDSSLNSQDHPHASTYSPLPTSAQNVPLMHNEDPSGDLSLQSLPSPDEQRRSIDSSRHETSSLRRVDTNLPQGSTDLRGEAPPYFEVVDHTPELNSEAPATQTSSSTPPDRQRRRSGFRTLLNRMSMVSHAPEHTRTDSIQSVSTLNTHRHERSTPSRTSNHRASPSGSGSLISASIFRPISPRRSNQTLNSSPSMISLNSISSPLSHTLMRTEFTYPKSGPTPQQLKLISSRENLSRFGVPYGPDAIAFAASSSRHDLEPPPPNFEASPSQPSLVRPGLSRLNSSSNIAADRQARPSVSEPTLKGAEHDGESRSSRPLPVDMQSENVANTSTHTEPSASPSISNVPNPLSPTSPIDNPSSSTSTTGFTARSESRTSNYSLQSYATAYESLG